MQNIYSQNISLVQISPLLVLDREEKEIVCNGTRVRLTKQQFKTFSYLVEQGSRWCELEELFEKTHIAKSIRVWVKGKRKRKRVPVDDPNEVMYRIIDRIRHVVRTAPGCADLLVIENNRGHGEYRICRNDECGIF